MRTQNNTTSTSVKYIPGAHDIAGIEEIYKYLTYISGILQKPEVIVLYDSPEIVEIRDIPRSQAKKEVLQLVNSVDQIYYSEISEKLHLDIEMVVDICNELEKDGSVQEAN